MSHRIHVEVRGELVGVGSFLLLNLFQRFKLCVYVFVHAVQNPCRTEEGVGSRGVVVTGSCEPPDVSAGYWI